MLPITYLPQAPFKVRPVCRCSDSMQGHQEAVLAVKFSPCGRHLITGSGDTTVRVWDLNTFTPKHTLKGHKNWVLCVEWSPNSRYFATGDMVGGLRVWDAETMQCVYSVPKAHSKYITSMSWEPLHRNKDSTRLATAGKDGVLRVWNVVRHVKEYASTCHSMSVTSVRWGGEGLIYTGSQDRTIKVHADKDGKLVRSLEGHGHWVNTLALNTDHVLRTGAFDYTGAIPASPEEAQAKALERYNAVKGNKPEVLVSGSDDFTCFLWHPSKDKKPIARLTGHQQPINLVSFSPDGNYLASASFDKSLKIWNGQTGK